MLHAVQIITAEKIIRLEEQIAAARNGQSEDFAEWRAYTEVVLRWAVGDDDQIIADFSRHQIWTHCGYYGHASLGVR